MSEPAKLAVAQQKGGTGKTTIAINLAGALSDRGHDVLLVDLDPQGNATECLGFRDTYDAEPPTLFDALTDPKQRDMVDELVVEHEEMDLLPSSIDMTAVEPELTLARRSGEQLEPLLDRIQGTYDYILVDCPPYLGNLMDNALLATENIIIPALAEGTSKRGFELLFDHVDALGMEYEISIDEQAVVTNRIDIRKTQANEMIEWIESAFGDTPVFEVRERAAIQRALSNHGSIFTKEPSCDQRGVFEDMADTLDNEFLPEVTA
jgi:ATPases involved in chromosome partitioning